MSWRNEWLLIKTQYLKITYFQALGYVKLQIFFVVIPPPPLSLSHDQVLNTVVLRLYLIFICIRMCVHAHTQIQYTSSNSNKQCTQLGQTQSNTSQCLN